MRPVCQSENSILSDSESKCYLVDKNTNKVKKRQKWGSNLCQDKQDWSTVNQECQPLTHLFLYNENVQQPFMFEPIREDGVDTWKGRSLENGENITSGKSGNVFFALCAPHTPDDKLTTKKLTGKSAGAQQQCSTTTTTAITTTTTAITITTTAIPTTTTPTTKKHEKQMSEQDLTNHLNRRKCPPSFISSTSNEGKSNSSPGVPLIDIFLNPERADELKQVQMETAPKMKKTHNQTKVKFKKTKSSCSFPGGAEEILPKHLPPSLALSDTLLPFQYFSRISTHAQVPLLNS